MDARHWTDEPRCIISRNALLHNAAILRKTVGPRVKICAIVKADAYGHGARIVAETLCRWSIDDLEAPMVDCLAVADLEEAAAIGDAGLPILVLRPIENAYLGRQRARLENAIQNGWTLTLCSMAAADDLARIALACGKRASVQIMIDTGMTRAGVHPSKFAELAAKVATLPHLRLGGVYTHFARSEEPDHAFNGHQLDQFAAVTHEFKVCRHAANSGAIFGNRATHLDMVRPGISLYGIDPLCRPSLERTLRPIMKWVAPLIDLRQVPAGASIGYGQSFVAPAPMRVGLVPVGYADGYWREFSHHGRMILHGQPVNVVGRVSMDLTTIDLTNVPAAALGDDVTLLDSDPLSPASVYQLAQWGRTIPYEILCRIGPRVRRIVAEDATRLAGDESAPDLNAGDYRS